MLLLALLGVVLFAAPAAASSALPEDDDLTLAEPAGLALVGLTVRPATPGDRELLVHLEPAAGGPPAEELDVRLAVDGRDVPLQRCGLACRRGQAEIDGGERVEVEVVGDTGGTAELTLPALPLADGRQLLERATERMNALASYRVEETLEPADPPIASAYAVAAPDRLRVVTDDARVTVRIGERVYRRELDEPHWRTSTAPALRVPNHIWDEDDAEPVAARILGTDRVDGVETQVVAFFLEVGDRPVWYRLWVDDSELVRAAEMLTSGHFMRHRYHAFDEPVTVEAPYGPVGHAGMALFGDPPGAYWEAGAAVARWAAFVGVLVAAGGVVFLGWVHDRRSDERGRLARFVAAAAVAAVAVTLVELPLRAVAEGGEGVGVLAESQGWQQALAGGRGFEVALRLVGLGGIVAILPRLWEPVAVRVAGIAALLASASLLPTGHSVAAEPRWLALAADFAHIVAAAGWLGGLVLLSATLRARRMWGEPLPATVVAAFSRLALACVAVLLPAGLVLAWVHLGGLAPLVVSPYGRTLLVKLALVAVVVAVAAYSRWRILQAIEAGDDRAWARLRRTLVGEVSGLVAVLAVTAVLVNVAPPA